MASTRAALLVLLVVSSCAAFSSAQQVDGRPRPRNFADEPSVTYDGTPMLTGENGPVDCIWYGFANILYDAATTTSCLNVLRMALTNETVNPPSNMKPYEYYTLKRLVDPANNESFCFQGCFNLGTTAAPPPEYEDGAPIAAPPLPAGEPPLAPEATQAPPPVTFGVPPSSSFSPAPSRFPDAPPPGMEPPVGAALPPASIVPPPGAAPELSIAPVAQPPAAPTTASPEGSSGAFLRPTGLLSTLVAFAAIFVAA